MNKTTKHVAIAVGLLIAYHVIWNAWPGEDYFRATHGGRGYFG